MVWSEAGDAPKDGGLVDFIHERHGLPLEAALQQVCSRRVEADAHPVFLRLARDYYAARNATQAQAVAGNGDATT